MRQWPKRQPLHIRNMFFIAILAVSIVPLIIMPVVRYNNTSRILNEKINTLTTEKVHQIALRFDDIIDDIIVGSNAVALDQEIYTIIHTNEKAFNRQKGIITKLQEVESANLYPYNVISTFIDFDGNVYTTAIFPDRTLPDFRQETWYGDTIDNNGFFLWRAPVNPALDSIQDVEAVALSRMLKTESGTPYGVFLMEVYLERKVAHILAPTDGLSSEEIYIVNEDGRIILSAKEDNQYYDEELFKEMGARVNEPMSIGGKPVVVNCQSVNKTDWKIVHIISTDDIYKETNELLRQTLLLNSLILILSMIFAYYVANWFTRPVRALSTIMDEAGEHGFKEKSKVTGSQEINKLSDSYNRMIDEIDGLIHDIQAQEKEKRQKHMEALQAQINPHFLLNTLNGIKWLCVIESAPSAEKMLLSLGQLLENMYFKNEEVVTLREEIDLLKSYCEIQKMRYGSRFDMTYDIEDTYMDMKIPVLLLQPIVENSIIHGLADVDDNGRIVIYVYEENEFIYISISDNGVGMDEHQAAAFFAKDTDKYGSIGMANVRDRVELYFGEGSGVTVSAAPNEGTEVLIRISVEERVVDQ